MKSIQLNLLLLFTAFAISANAQTQKTPTADEIINKYIAAVGGKEKLENMKSIQMTGAMSVMGNEAPLTISILNGKGYKSEVDFNGQKIIQAFNEKGGWMVNPMMGNSSPQPIPDEQFQASKDQIYIAGQLYNYASKGYKAEAAGTENINNVNALKVVVTDKTNSPTIYYFDPSTYYMLRATKKLNVNGQESEISSTFSDYRKTDYGYTLPYSVETALPTGMSITATINKVEINQDMDPQIFEMPKS